jgi:hypothetical protein
MNVPAGGSGDPLEEVMRRRGSIRGFVLSAALSAEVVCAGVRYRRKLGLWGSDTAVAEAARPAGSRPAS